MKNADFAPIFSLKTVKCGLCEPRLKDLAVESASMVTFFTLWINALSAKTPTSWGPLGERISFLIFKHDRAILARNMEIRKI